MTIASSIKQNLNSAPAFLVRGHSLLSPVQFLVKVDLKVFEGRDDLNAVSNNVNRQVGRFLLPAKIHHHLIVDVFKKSQLP